ncbi:MAG TPA: MarR family transcriptional regulator [Casimicrobiaceae bacterium]|nr:MarR family transcriptional regulator [Casimicrobiaceae bacterium]
MKRTARYGAPPRSGAERTWRLLVELVMETRGEWRRQVAEATGLPFSRVRALWRLERGPRTLAELAHDLGTDAPATTVLVNALEQRGLVTRVAHPTDKRAKQVSLTAAGRRVLAVVEKITDRPPAAFERLTEEEVERLRRTLQKLL